VVLTLVDWRVRVAALYAQVRDDADPERGHATWRQGRDALFRTHPQSPLPARDPLRETGLPYWPYDPAWRFELSLLPAPSDASDPDERVVDGGGDGDVTMLRTGQLALPSGSTLDVWTLQQYAGGIFVPLRDATSGADGGSYGAGRYLLDTAKGSWLGGGAGPRAADEPGGGAGPRAADEPGGGAGPRAADEPGGGQGSTVVLDLNFAYHPSCRYDDRWRCPLASPGNTVTDVVEAGERLHHR
jgi:uncharacterized protein (DUF1684 family)